MDTNSEKVKEKEVIQKNIIKRCSYEKCNKKLKIISFDCRCGGMFCPEHRYTSKHNCPSLEDKKKTCKQELEKNNPVIGFSKVIKI